MAFASVTFEECGLHPSVVHDGFENPSLPSCRESDVRVDSQRERTIISGDTQDPIRRVYAGRSTDPDPDYANVGHRLHIWMPDGKKACRTLTG